MAKIEIPQELRKKLGNEMKMDIHWIDVKLKNKKTYKKLVVRGGRFITGSSSDPDGIGDLDFTSSDIFDLRRTSWLPFW
jgi:hypothetical protein